MDGDGTVLLSRNDVERLLTPDACIAAVEDAFRQHALGKVPPPGILGMHGGEGSLHVKAALLATDRQYFAAKLNANFPNNGPRYGLPTIQGVVVLCDATNGAPLAILADEHDTARRIAFAEHGLRGVAKERARGTARRLLAQCVKRRSCVARERSSPSRHQIAPTLPVIGSTMPVT